MNEEQLKKKIKEKRPKLKENSLSMYINNLKKMNSKLDNKNLFDVDILNNKQKVNDFLKEKSKNTQKNYYSSFVVILDIDDKYEALKNHYRNKMEEIGQTIQTHIKSQGKSTKQEKNWMDLKQLQKVLKDTKKEIDKKGLLKKNSLTKKELNLIQQWVAVSLYILDPIKNPPLRADYNMEIINLQKYNNLTDQEKKKNYLVVKGKIKKFFHLGEYKSDSAYGEKQIEVGSKLNSVLNHWLKINKTKFLLFDSKNHLMTPNQLSKYITQYFRENTNKNIGISLIRHIVITHLYPPDLKERENTASLMAHSVEQQTEYSKK